MPSATPTFIDRTLIPTVAPTPTPPDFGAVTSTPPPVGPNVLGMQLFDDGPAVLLTEEKLYTTALIPPGAKIVVAEVDITPPGVVPGEIKGFHFLDHDHGWVVAYGGSDASTNTQVVVLRTTDGGESWQSYPLAQLDPLYTSTQSHPAYIDFLDETHGWVVINPANSYAGELYRTEDGGQSWTELTSPAAGPIFFANQNDGWEEFSPISSTLFITHDGGATWTDGFPNGHPPRDAAIYDLPVELTDGSLILATTGEQLNVNRSTDNGQTWTSIASGAVSGLGEILPHIFPDGRIVGIPQDGVRGLVLASGPAQFLEFQVKGLSGATAIDFATANEGWALVNQSGCRSFKSDCWSVNYIEQTDDGGYNWTPVFLPKGTPTPSP